MIFNELSLAFGTSGLWHGAAYDFLAWGLWHGVLLVAHRAWSSLGVPSLAAVGIGERRCV
jgi:D-alanyl-lipoteichoic acid acyltransferase DltB (MBOAT superfamily)